VKDRHARAEGLLWRGERLANDARTKSFFANDFFGTSNRPPAGATEAVTGGVLWIDVLCATQTSVVHDGWDKTGGLDSVTSTWDAWTRQSGRGRPILPRRVRIELELERPADRIRRTTTVEPMETGDGALRVDDARYLPFGEDRYVLVDAEWMKVVTIDGNHVAVQRAQRGTTAVMHEAGAMVHFGERLVREVPIATYREDWDLR
jgi:hypothetical protein